MAKACRFKRYAERLIAEWRKARHDVSLGETGLQLAVGGTIRVWDAGMQEWVHDVHRAYPDLALILESHTPDTLEQAMGKGYIWIDWGLSVALQYQRLCPDAHQPTLRIANASVALEFILEFGGAGYLASREIADEIKDGELFLVKGAGRIQRSVYAIHPVRTDRLELINDVIGEFRYRVSLPKRPRRTKRS